MSASVSNIQFQGQDLTCRGQHLSHAWSLLWEYIMAVATSYGSTDTAYTNVRTKVRAVRIWSDFAGFGPRPPRWHAQMAEPRADGACGCAAWQNASSNLWAFRVECRAVCSKSDILRSRPTSFRVLGASPAQGIAIRKSGKSGWSLVICSCSGIRRCFGRAFQLLNSSCKPLFGHVPTSTNPTFQPTSKSAGTWGPKPRRLSRGMCSTWPRTLSALGARSWAPNFRRRRHRSRRGGRIPAPKPHTLDLTR